MIPTFSRAGRNPSNCTIADDPHKSLLVSFQSREAGTGRSSRLYRDRQPGRCVVRLNLRGGGDGRPRTGWFAAVPAGRPPTGHRIAAPTRKAPRRCDGEHSPVAAATSPDPGPEPASGAAAVGAAAATSPERGPRIRRRGRSALQSAATVRVDRIRSIRRHPIRLADPTPIRTADRNGGPGAPPAARRQAHRCRPTDATACLATAHCRRPTMVPRGFRPVRRSSCCRALRGAATGPRS
jgi:hypothetical protein